MPNNREILKEYRYIYIKKHNTTIININYEYIKAGNCLGDAKFKKEITMTNEVNLYLAQISTNHVMSLSQAADEDSATNKTSP